MKKLLLIALAALSVTTVSAGTITIVPNTSQSSSGWQDNDGTPKEYQLDTLISRDVGPGIHYLRLRLPEYPLNVNMLIMDLNNPYNRVETTTGQDYLTKTESLVAAAKRQSYEGHNAIGGANGNFWCVSSQYPFADLITGVPFAGSMKDGKIITETNNFSDQWEATENGNSPKRIGSVGISLDKKLYINRLRFGGIISNDKIGSCEIYQANKYHRENEYVIYNSFYGTSKKFQPAEQYTGDGGQQHFRVLEDSNSTEVMLTINEGQRWLAGRPMACTVQEVRTNAGRGTLGSYDLAIVGFGTAGTNLAKLAPGDQVSVYYAWYTFNNSDYSPKEIPELEQLICGNAFVMEDGERNYRNFNEQYNYQIYSRCAYGASADGKTLYVIVIDKSTDPVYGQSKGCNTNDMCWIAKHYGVSNLSSMDAGGSAQLLVDRAIVNKTTESSPRAVANGWLLYSTAPTDNQIARLEFDAVNLTCPPYSTFSPTILGYNQYGDLIDKDVKGYTLSCDPALGTCDGSEFTANGDPMTANLTATLNGVSISKPLTITDAQLQIRIKPQILTDFYREYPMEVTATVGMEVFTYNPAAITWSVDDPTIASIDENGVLRGLKEGTTKVTGTIGKFVDNTDVKVEVSKSPEMTSIFGTSVKAVSGITNSAINNGVITFTYGSPRSPYVQANDLLTFYSLPDRVTLRFNSSVELTFLEVDYRENGNDRTSMSKIYLDPNNTAAHFMPNQDYEVELPISLVGDPDDIILYPLSLHAVKFNIVSSSSNKGDQTITLYNVTAHYNHYDASVEPVSIDSAIARIYPNPVTDHSFTVAAAAPVRHVKVYSLAGAEVAVADGSASTLNVEIPALPAGVYIVKVETDNGNMSSKLIVK
ncbi:MAG: T9SS type A sorting domain-containing protein [Muribaculaceae bacterium]|nr:T9SS type A sorting domain-containing protein [Muribaculaceae bacterium]